MKGFIAFYINFSVNEDQEVQKRLDMLRLINKEVFENITKDGEYQIVVVPTTNEACRIEKIDYDKPFPRFVASGHDLHGKVKEDE